MSRAIIILFMLSFAFILTVDACSKSLSKGVSKGLTKGVSKGLSKGSDPKERRKRFAIGIGNDGQSTIGSGDVSSSGVATTEACKDLKPNDACEKEIAALYARTKASSDEEKKAILDKFCNGVPAKTPGWTKSSAIPASSDKCPKTCGKC